MPHGADRLTIEGEPAAPALPPGNGHAQRSAATRLRLIEAAIDCLYRTGYGATTTVAIAQTAGVSRGAMLHQFPTRADLIIAVAEHIVREQDLRRRQILRAVPRGVERFRAITAAVWDTMKEPASMALLEIMLGSRSDPELSARFPAVMRGAEARLASGPIEVARDIGFEQDDLIHAMSRLHLAAMRGLAIERLFQTDEGRVDDAFELLTWYKDQFLLRLSEAT
ncbi:TetR/AcrR family transcriptional regulator [Sphingomonas aracearum]|uniref:TetR/AcrR family transcriptional regulator n=1 Tax=Sphingomonas aracearum TaxID=2283317 RepID=A0A369W087_9SPHN|nr:TetR/AcrR family transcriptional regulator [Sphingomonas aracearum]RDE07327.1 TetR/AcrR family transcriptional regulator [Sphingomonas aracearum]